ncbi:MAG: homoserine kinase [SAR202 cluster bacterium Io17-Chloro-G3]|nr:MAG: homoserine kinase [SAR202 cluster bacterium Io17-Chloro-G3]
MDSFTVRAPATTANLGPGFDCLGLALDVWNQVRFAPGNQPGVEVTGEGEGELRTDTENLVYRAVQSYFQEIRSDLPPFSIVCHNEIPLARGLGSSAAAIVSGLLGASVLAGENPPDLDRLLRLAVALEGHPDNVVAALFGGCQIIVQEKGEFFRSEIPIAMGLRAVLFIPDVRISTQEARDVLEAKLDRSDAVYNVGRVALLVNALATGSLNNLRIATQDRLHQPSRQNLLPAMPLLFRSALDAGALGVFLSGAGSTILAISTGKELTIAYEMADAANKAGLSGQVKIAGMANQGAYVVPVE